MALAERLREAFAGRRVLVTGHTGFKGGWLAHALAQLGAEVHGLALAPDTTPALFDVTGLRARLASHHEVDLRDMTALGAVFHRVQPEVVFHLAAQPLVLASYRDPKGTFDVNVGGTVNVCELVRTHGCVRAFVNVTSDKCYENREWVWAYRENDALGGHDPYSASKGAAEVVFSAYLRSFFQERPELGAASARAGNVIGAGDWAADRIVPDAVRALVAHTPVDVRRPLAVRPWQHVLEPVGGYLMLAAALLEQPKVFSGAWNFGPEPENAQPVKTLVEALVTAWGEGTWKDVSTPHAPHEAHFLRLDATQARTLLGWRPRWDFARTVHETVRGYRLWHEGGDLRALLDLQTAAWLEGAHA